MPKQSTIDNFRHLLGRSATQERVEYAAEAVDILEAGGARKKVVTFVIDCIAIVDGQAYEARMPAVERIIAEAAPLTVIDPLQTKLYDACRDMARSVLYDTSDHGTINDLARRYTAVAIEQLELVAGLGGDLAAAVRAVRYLSAVHAIPPCGDDTNWFRNMLRAVLEIAFPNASPGDDSSAFAFVNDMKVGLAALMVDKP